MTTNNTNSYVLEPSEDEALLDFASVDDGNNSVRFEDYKPDRALTQKWLDHIIDIVG